MDDQPALAEFQVSANSFRKVWDRETPYGGKNNPGDLTWRVEYIRGPTCDSEKDDKGEPIDEDYQRKNFKEEFWQPDEWVECCNAKDKGLETPAGCDRSSNSRARLTSSEVGYFLDFKFDPETGFPYGCDIFDDFKEFQTLDPSENQEELAKISQIGNVVRPEDYKVLKNLDDGVNRSKCRKQSKIKDEKNGRSIWKTVEMFARKEKLDVWHKEFLEAYQIIATNNNENLVQNEDFFMAHGCQCFTIKLNFGVKQRASLVIELENQKALKVPWNVWKSAKGKLVAMNFCLTLPRTSANCTRR